MEGDDAVQEQLGKLLRRDGGDGGNEVAHLGEAVDHGEDCVVAAIGGKRCDEVHADVRPALLGYGQGLEQASWKLVAWFVSLASRTGADVLAGDGGDVGPVEAALEMGDGFVEA